VASARHATRFVARVGVVGGPLGERQVVVHHEAGADAGAELVQPQGAQVVEGVPTLAALVVDAHFTGRAIELRLSARATRKSPIRPVHVREHRPDENAEQATGDQNRPDEVHVFVEDPPNQRRQDSRGDHEHDPHGHRHDRTTAGESEQRHGRAHEHGPPTRR